MNNRISLKSNLCYTLNNINLIRNWNVKNIKLKVKYNQRAYLAMEIHPVRNYQLVNNQNSRRIRELRSEHNFADAGVVVRWVPAPVVGGTLPYLS